MGELVDIAALSEFYGMNLDTVTTMTLMEAARQSAIGNKLELLMQTTDCGGDEGGTGLSMAISHVHSPSEESALLTTSETTCTWSYSETCDCRACKMSRFQASKIAWEGAVTPAMVAAGAISLGSER